MTEPLSKEQQMERYVAKLHKQPKSLRPDSIAQFEQNKPYLIVRDLLHIIHKECPSVNINWMQNTIFAILLARGVFKSFSVRRFLWKLKCSLKAEVTDLLKAEREAKLLSIEKPDEGTQAKFHYLHGYRRGVESVYKRVKAVCLISRWTAPDNDRLAINWIDLATLKIEHPEEFELAETMMKEEARVTDQPGTN